MSKVKPSLFMERAFINDDINKLSARLDYLYNRRLTLWSSIRKLLSFFDYFRFSKYLSLGDEFYNNQAVRKNDRHLSLLVKSRFGEDNTDFDKHIFNFSDLILSDLEKSVLSKGLNFCIPPKKMDKVQLMTEFEILFCQLLNHVPRSSDALSSL